MKHSIVVRIVVVMVNFVDAHPLNDLTAAKVYSQDQIARMACLVLRRNYIGRTKAYDVVAS